MPTNDDLGMRLKHNYEEVSKYRLTRRMPVAIRLDGRAFHTFTRGFRKPFDEILGYAMVQTMKYLCENIQNCVFSYTQSDEITLILVDYQKLSSDAWFDYEIQKMCSISASMATMSFNRFFKEEYDKWASVYANPFNGVGTGADMAPKAAYLKAIEKGAMFDARCFNIPKEEVTNLIFWRQLDARRNSIQMVGQANFSHSELQGKSCNMIQDMLVEQRGINWNNYPTRWKRGVACYKTKDKEIIAYNKAGNPLMKYDQPGGWVIDYEMPMLKGEDRAYLDRHIFVGE